MLVDGEHYPPVVRAAIEHLPSSIPGCTVVGAVLLAAGEKAGPGDFDLGVDVVDGPTPDDALAEGLRRFAPDLVFDMADEPVLDARARLRLASRVLAAGIPYRGADFHLDPPPRPRVATKPSIAVIGTGKRTGKTAVSAQLARTLAAAGRPPVIVAMGRGGPAEPELVDPATFDLTPTALVALAAVGRHAASDNLEDAVVANVGTVGTRRCGGGLAGAPADSTFAAGVALANGRPEELLVLEGSGQAIPPVHADATVCVVPGGADPELVTGYLGAYRILLSDVIVITMGDASSAGSGADAPTEPHASRRVAALEGSVRGVAPGVRVVHVVLRPFPLEPISGRRVFHVTTAPAPVSDLLAGHLEREHGASIVGTSSNLADRRRLAGDLERMGDAEVLVVELKAAGVDLAARVALERGMEVVFCDNRVVSVGGDGTFEVLALETAQAAAERFGTQRSNEQ